MDPTGQQKGIPAAREAPGNRSLPPFSSPLENAIDSSVGGSAPAFTGAAGPLGAPAGSAAVDASKSGPISRAREFHNNYDGEILTNNSDDGATSVAAGRA